MKSIFRNLIFTLLAYLTFIGNVISQPGIFPSCPGINPIQPCVCPGEIKSYNVLLPFTVSKCGNHHWKVEGGTIIGANNLDYVVIEWGNVSSGKLIYSGNNCLDNNGMITFPQKFEQIFPLFKFDLILLTMAPQEPLCKNELTFALVHPHGGVTGNLHINSLSGINWVEPSGWTILSGQGTPLITIATNNNFSGIKTISVEFNTSCNIVKYSRDVTIDATVCVPLFNYQSIPNYHQSHSSEKTIFLPNPTINLNNLGSYNFRYASGRVVELYEGFQFSATSESSLNLLIEGCDCESDFHDPNNMGIVTINFNSINPGGGNLINESNNFAYEMPENYIKQKEVILFPNPFSGQLIKIQGLYGSHEYDFSLININGETVPISIERLNETDYNLSVLSKLNKGIYILGISDNFNFNKFFKVIVNE
jgi:hypothetical protein